MYIYEIKPFLINGFMIYHTKDFQIKVTLKQVQQSWKNTNCVWYAVSGNTGNVFTDECYWAYQFYQVISGQFAQYL